MMLPFLLFFSSNGIVAQSVDRSVSRNRLPGVGTAIPWYEEVDPVDAQLASLLRALHHGRDGDRRHGWDGLWICGCQQ